MRDLLNQNRPLSPDTINLGVLLLNGLFGVSALLICFFGLMNFLPSGNPLIGLLQITAGLGILLALYLIVRLLGEAVAALHRMNDRATILSDALRPRASAASAPAGQATPKHSPKPAKPTRKPAPANAAAREED